MSEEKIKYFCDMDALEPFCIALRVRSTIVFMYPFMEVAAKHNPKIVTKRGELVKHIQPATNECKRIIVGELNGERLTWDTNGKFLGDCEDDSKNLYIFERYWDAQWKSRIKLSHGEWALKYQRPHPNVKIPDAWAEKARRRIND